MKIDDLKILSAIFQEPNLTKISQRYHVSQSNLSKIIRKVEDELGFALFERKGFHGLKPTTQGTLFAERIQRFARSWDDTISLVKSYDQQRLDIKVTGPSLYMRNIFLPRWFASPLHEQFRLTYVQSRIDQIALAAEAGDIDLVITPSPFELTEWVPIPIFTEKFALFYSAKKAVKSLNEIDLSNKFWVAYRASNDVLHSFLHQNQISSESITAYIDDVESILDVIQNNPKMLSLLPSHAANTHRDLKSLPIKGNSGQSLYLMYRSGNSMLHESVRQLRKILTAEGPPSQ